MNVTAKPFVKWAGGKTQLLDEIRKKYPQKIEKYCEPFVGGGAVLFDVLSTFHPQEVLINDINAELINTYAQIKTNCDALISQLACLQEKYRASTLEENKAFFYEKRNRFNELKINGNEAENLEKAALFIFLNKTCFNGLYRVNAKGLFNVPFNSAKNPLLCDEENLRSCSELLQNVEMRVGDYSQCADFIDDKTFVYIDPPYRPLTQTQAFTAYSENGFGDEEQVKLAQFAKEMNAQEARIVASNSDPKNIDVNDNFFNEIYKGFIVETVYAKRAINSKGSKRGNVSELLISSFDQDEYIPVTPLLRESFSRYGKFLPKFEISKIKIDKTRLSYANDISISEVENIAYNFHRSGWEPITIDDEFYLRDGQHRLAAAKLMGLKYIDAFIFVDKPASKEKKSRRRRDIF